ncbi:MAG TPA: response regulator transcription factor [Candidatus Acidoferrum sp.]|jgi:two-component system invasion response regulator UvrY|nr:response regulator transcription factor [Candidatus Acidoferrum sp.]
MRILIADDHALLREGLRQILAEAFPDAEFGGAGTTSETLACLARRRWDILVLDVFMPGRSGLEVLHEVRQNHPKLPVLVLSSAPEEQLALRVLKDGARGYLNKQTAPQDLVQAVRKILAGGKYVTDTLAEKLVTEVGRAGRLPHERLSDREFQVMQLLLAGRSLKEVAGELSLSVKTIRTFHTRLLKKLALKNDVQLVHYALEHRLVERKVLPRSSNR